MYIMITNRCNMKCPHCMFSCNENGIDMPMDILKASLNLAEKYDESICLGGGEPTLHPNFWEIIGLSLGSQTSDIPLFIATNGSNTEISLKLAKMAKNGIIYIALSVDGLHEPIDQKVIEVFTKKTIKENDMREIRDVSEHIVNKGRAIESELGSSDDCGCEGPFIDPLGDIYVCGCKEIKIGNVISKPEIPQWFWELDEKCSNSKEFENETII